MTDKKEIWLLERTKDLESNIIGFYSTKNNAVDAVRRYVTAVIDKAIREESGDVVGVYISEGFLLTRSEVEIDPDVTFAKVEDIGKFPGTHGTHHVAEDLGDVDLNQQGDVKDGGDIPEVFTQTGVGELE